MKFCNVEYSQVEQLEAALQARYGVIATEWRRECWT